MKKLLAIFLAIGLFYSCKKDKPVQLPDFGYDYYPDQLGRFVIYYCDSIVYHDAPLSDTQTFKFQIKEKIDSIYTDNQGRPTLRISRYKKLQQVNDSVYPSNQSWTLQDVWWANKTSSDAEVVEENIRFVKLVFPIEINKTWNGNAQNTNGTWNYTYTEVDVPKTVSSIPFEKTLHVKQYDSGNNHLVNKQYDETYARNAGLILKEITDYTWKQDATGVLIGKIQYGLYYKMQAFTYGVE